MVITKVSLFMCKRSLSSYFIKLANHENPMAFSCSGILCIIKIISIFFSSSSGSWSYYDDVIGTIEDKSVASVRYNKAVLTFTHCLKSYFSPISD